jgi:putative flippase GtrA
MRDAEDWPPGPAPRRPPAELARLPGPTGPRSGRLLRSTRAGSIAARLACQPVYRYIVVGGIVYVFEIAAILTAQRLGASAVLAVGLSFWFGLILSFVLQKLVTFSDKRLHHKVLVPQLVAFSLLVLFNFGFTILVTKLLEHELPAVITRTLAIGITTLWNFYLYKTRIFTSSLALLQPADACPEDAA